MFPILSQPDHLKTRGTGPAYTLTKQITLYSIVIHRHIVILIAEVHKEINTKFSCIKFFTTDFFPNYGMHVNICFKFMIMV